MADAATIKLLAACECGDAVSVRELIKSSGANANYSDPDSGSTPLLLALIQENFEVISELLDAGALGLGDDEIDYLYVASGLNRAEELIHLLLRHKARFVHPLLHTLCKHEPINLTSPEVKRFLGLVDSNVILNYAAKHNYPELVAWAVDEAEADVAAVDSLKNPPIITAALAGHLEIVQFLASAADQKLAGAGNLTVLLASAFTSKLPVFQWALTSGYSHLHESRSWGWTAVTHCIIGNAPEILHWLIAEQKLTSTLVNSKDDEGNTALHHCALHNRIDMARVLLDKGNADPRARNRAGETPLAIATRAKHPELAEMLQKYIRDSRKRFLLRVFSVKEWIILFVLVLFLLALSALYNWAEAQAVANPAPQGNVQLECPA